LTISEERKKCVIDLYYNQGKTTREIAKIERMSIRDISAILKKEESKRQKYKDQEISSKAYELFSQGKTPLQVVIALNIRQSEATKYYREYWKLKRHYKLHSVYVELGEEGIGDFLKLYKLTKKEGTVEKQVVKLLQLVDEDNLLDYRILKNGAIGL
jgi:hypothetical protein